VIFSESVQYQRRTENEKSKRLHKCGQSLSVRPTCMHQVPFHVHGEQVTSNRRSTASQHSRYMILQEKTKECQYNSQDEGACNMGRAHPPPLLSTQAQLAGRFPYAFCCCTPPWSSVTVQRGGLPIACLQFWILSFMRSHCHPPLTGQRCYGSLNINTKRKINPTSPHVEATECEHLEGQSACLGQRSSPAGM
jgi:hypothetical protein